MTLHHRPLHVGQNIPKNKKNKTQYNLHKRVLGHVRTIQPLVAAGAAGDCCWTDIQACFVALIHL